MEDKWQVVFDRCWNIAMDIQRGINLKSHITGRNYIILAWRRALAVHEIVWAAKFKQCLHMAWPKDIINALSKAA